MREIQATGRYMDDLYGITPAYAGNTGDSMRTRTAEQDHPRVCGKYSVRPQTISTERGSPPRMREILVRNERNRMATRITPAYAGNTFGVSFTIFSDWDHPRVCGKYVYNFCINIIILGSPPRMREIHSALHLQPNNTRITPAYAGNTR